MTTVHVHCTSNKDEQKKLGKLSKFRIRKETRKLLKEQGVKYLFPIQYMTFDPVYDGKDVIGQARTGTGKTLSFVLPLLERLVAEGSEGGLRKPRGRPPVVLVMAPTRELANQVYGELKALSDDDISSFCIYGGAGYEPQESAIARGLDVVVGTPGRILDHINRGTLDLTKLK
jgi:ATP-dependent RNA helicase DDX21